jgi:TPR repeat protein
MASTTDRLGSVVLSAFVLGLGGAAARAEDAADDLAQADRPYRRALVEFVGGDPNRLPKTDAELIELLKQAAVRGNPTYQYDLGLRYLEGRGVAQDCREAIRWFRVTDGSVVDNDTTAAHDCSAVAAWHRQKAETGDLVSILVLGDMYGKGQGIPRDDREAATWYEQGADQGIQSAQHALGHLYRQGLGVPQDLVKAYVWLRLALTAPVPPNPEESPAEAQPRMEAARALQEVAAQLTAQQRMDAETQASAWQPKMIRETLAKQQTSTQDVLTRAEHGDADAQCEVGEWYAGGYGVPKDDTKARDWYRRAAQQGHAKAQATLGSDLYYATLNHQLPSETYAEAFRWLTQAAEQGQAMAQADLANMYAFGRGVPEDWSKKIYWDTQAAEQGHEGAAKSLSDDYWYGRPGVPKDPANAYYWMKIGARHASGMDQERLAESAVLLTPEQVAELDRKAAAWKPHGPDLHDH